MSRHLRRPAKNSRPQVHLLQTASIVVASVLFLYFVSVCAFFQSVSELKMPMIDVLTAFTHSAPKDGPVNRPLQKGVAQQVSTKTKTSRRDLPDYSVLPQAGWWMKHVHQLARVYSSKAVDDYDWCTPEASSTPARLKGGRHATGLLYVKLYQASPSVGEGVSLAIANNLARRVFNSSTPCVHYNRHEFSDAKGHGRRESSDPNHRRSLLWTFVRHPAKRDIDEVFFQYFSRNKIPATEQNVIRLLWGMRGRQTRYILPHWSDFRVLKAMTLGGGGSNNTASVKSIAPGDSKDSKKIVIDSVAFDETTVANTIDHEIMQKFDFVGVSERKFESLAVMKLLYSLDWEDVIVLSSDHDFDDGSTKHAKTKAKKCVRVQEQFTTPLIDKFISSAAHSKHNADYLLYSAADRSLDLTIHALGWDRVQQVAADLERLQDLAESSCLSKAIFPCSADGKIQINAAKKSCYVQDVGCGHSCVAESIRGYLDLTKSALLQ